LDKTAPKHISDTEAIGLIKQLAGIKHCQDVSSLPKEQRDTVFSSLKQKGCSVRQIARLTGVNRGIIHRAWRSAGA
jgi:transposase-like protein